MEKMTFKGSYAFYGKYLIPILSIHTYYPYKTGKFDEVSRQILNYKNNDDAAVKRFTDDLKACMTEYACEKSRSFKDWIICVVPSHNANEWGQALCRTANMLSTSFDMKMGTGFLVRHTTHEKLSTGGNRSVDSHLETIRLSEGADVKGKKVMVIDDVRTTGASLIACKEILIDAGASEVCLVAIAKTF